MMDHEPFIVIVTGSRHAKLDGKIFEVLDELSPDMIVQGGANGVDAIAKRWAVVNDIACCTVPALWKTLGPAAGPVRNGKMLWLHPGATVAAFPCSSSTGTWNCVEQANAAKHQVIITKLGGGWPAR